MSQLLPYVILLACPLSMGAMMWMMMRGMGNRPGKPRDEARIRMLEDELRELREHRDADPTRDPLLAASKH
jgi:hypothetical protein